MLLKNSTLVIDLAQLQAGLCGVLHPAPEVLHHLEKCLALLLGVNPLDEVSAQVYLTLCQVIHNTNASGEHFQLVVVRGEVPGGHRVRSQFWGP